MLLIIHSLVILLWTFLLFFYFIRGAKRMKVEVNFNYFLSLSLHTIPLITWFLFVFWG